jgi:hypothetical protein
LRRSWHTVANQAVRELDATALLALQDGELLLQRGILRL